MIKVLLVGQLPKDVGGNYTTGIAKVVYELSRQKLGSVQYAVYATNAKQGNIQITGSSSEYYGYKYLVGRMIRNILINPLQTLKEWRIYKQSAKVNPLRYEFYKANFQKVIKQVNPDIIHMNGCGIEPLYFANKNRIPVILTCHGVFQRTVNPQSAAKLYADYVTGLTDETLEEIKNYLCVAEDKITIIPNGVDSKQFYYSEEERARIRAEIGVNPETRVFITVASVQERKGQLRFTQLLKDWSESNWEYWIVGKGPDEEAIKNYCELHGLSGKVRLLGLKRGAELYKYYSAADIYAHASTMEGQALCEIEAFSTGLKILVNDIIKGTIAKNELEIGDYLMMDFAQPDYKKISEWYTKRKTPRQSVSTMDWKCVAVQYGELYKKLISIKK